MKLKIEFVDGDLSGQHPLSPRYATLGAAGMDLCAAIKDPIVLEPGKRALIPAGFKIEIPYGYEAQIRPRSGLALKHGVTVLNSPGTIDSDYRGEVGVVLINHGEQPFTIEPGARIAQMVIARVEMTELVLGEVGESERGEGGFGHTGLEVRTGEPEKVVEIIQQDPPIGQSVWRSNEKTVVGVAYDISDRRVVAEINDDGSFQVVNTFSDGTVQKI